MNDVNNLGSDLFAFRTSYNDPQRGGTPQYIENLSESEWRTANDNVARWYSYSYDGLNRMTGADSYNGNYDVSFTYDKMGNIQSLTRDGWQNGSPYANMDVLDYDYHNGEVSNRLYKVKDTGNNSYGFKDSSVDDQDYWYDQNGNMIRDDNKGITDIEYNHLNMPTKITVNGNGNNGVIDYVYSADGTKLQKKKTEGGVTATTDYIGNFVYEGGNLKQITHPEGYIEPDGSSWQYVYRLTDIWDNTRITFADDNGDGSVNASEIRREQNYYPGGLEHKGYNTSSYGVKNDLKTFQKQEFTEDLGLGFHEWRYRASYPDIVRFWQIDPLAEDYMYNSTHAFQENKFGMGVELEGLENASYSYNGNAQAVITRNQMNITEEDRKLTNQVRLAAVTLVIPGPEDVVLAGFVATKIGGAVMRGLSKLLGKSASKVDDVVDTANDTSKLNKNANDAEGNFVLYEVKQSDEILKVGKANADDVMADGTTIRRVHTSTRKAKKEGYNNATGEVVEDLGTTTTKKAKEAEAARVRNHRENGNELPLNRERDKSYKPNNGS